MLYYINTQVLNTAVTSLTNYALSQPWKPQRDSHSKFIIYGASASKSLCKHQEPILYYVLSYITSHFIILYII